MNIKSNKRSHTSNSYENEPLNENDYVNQINTSYSKDYILNHRGQENSPQINELSDSGEEDEDQLLDELKEISREISRDMGKLPLQKKKLNNSNRFQEEKIKKVQEKMGKLAKNSNLFKKKTNAEFMQVYEKFKIYEMKKQEKLEKFREEKIKLETSNIFDKPQLIAKKKPCNRQPLVSRIDQIIKSKNDKMEEKRKALELKREEEMMAGVTFVPKINENTESLLNKSWRMNITTNSKDQTLNETNGILSRLSCHYFCTQNHTDHTEECLFKPKINKISEILADNIKKKTSNKVEERLKIHDEIKQINHALLVKSVTPSFSPCINPNSNKFADKSRQKRTINHNHSSNSGYSNTLSISSSTPNELLKIYKSLDISNIKDDEQSYIPTIDEQQEEEIIDKIDSVSNKKSIRINKRNRDISFGEKNKFEYIDNLYNNTNPKVNLCDTFSLQKPDEINDDETNDNSNKSNMMILQEAMQSDDANFESQRLYECQNIQINSNRNNDKAPLSNHDVGINDDIDADNAINNEKDQEIDSILLQKNMGSIHQNLKILQESFQNFKKELPISNHNESNSPNKAELSNLSANKTSNKNMKIEKSLNENLSEQSTSNLTFSSLSKELSATVNLNNDSPVIKNSSSNESPDFKKLVEKGNDSQKLEISKKDSVETNRNKINEQMNSLDSPEKPNVANAKSISSANNSKINNPESLNQNEISFENDTCSFDTRPNTSQRENMATHNSTYNSRSSYSKALLEMIRSDVIKIEPKKKSSSTGPKYPIEFLEDEKKPYKVSDNIDLKNLDYFNERSGSIKPPTQNLKVITGHSHEKFREYDQKIKGVYAHSESEINDSQSLTPCSSPERDHRTVDNLLENKEIIHLLKDIDTKLSKSDRVLKKQTQKTIIMEKIINPLLNEPKVNESTTLLKENSSDKKIKPQYNSAILLKQVSYGKHAFSPNKLYTNNVSNTLLLGRNFSLGNKLNISPTKKPQNRKKISMK